MSYTFIHVTTTKPFVEKAAKLISEFSECGEFIDEDSESGLVTIRFEYKFGVLPFENTLVDLKIPCDIWIEGGGDEYPTHKYIRFDEKLNVVTHSFEGDEEHTVGLKALKEAVMKGVDAVQNLIDEKEKQCFVIPWDVQIKYLPV